MTLSEDTTHEDTTHGGGERGTPPADAGPTPPGAGPRPGPGPESDDRRAHRTELLLGNLLRVGVVGSLLIILTGTVLTFAHHHGYRSDPAELPPLLTYGAPFPRTLAEVGAGLPEGQGRSVVIVGLLLLIATPVLRVAASVVAFLVEGDRVFALITGIVLALLLLSFALGKAG